MRRRRRRDGLGIMERRSGFLVGNKDGENGRYAGPQRPFCLQCGVIESLKELQKKEELRL